MAVTRLVQTVGRLSYSTSTKVASAVVGTSGRQYVRGDLLHRDQRNRPTIFKAICGNEPFALKYDSKLIYNFSRRLAASFSGSAGKHLRMPVDFSRQDDAESEHVVMYPFFRDTLLDLMRADPDFPPEELQKALRSVGEGIRAMHERRWIHLDVKPDNIFINWDDTDRDAEGNRVKRITGTALGEFGISFRPEGDTPLRTKHPVGNFMWRSPEGQTGSGVTIASDVYSFGLVCIYALGGGSWLLMEDNAELAQLADRGIMPEQAVLTRHFMFFGPATEGLLMWFDERWRETLEGVSRDGQRSLEEHPHRGFRVWGEGLGEKGLDMISGMTNPDPTARLTIQQVVKHEWWEESG